MALTEESARRIQLHPLASGLGMRRSVNVSKIMLKLIKLNNTVNNNVEAYKSMFQTLCL